MKKNVVPTLTPAGWVTNVVDKLDFLITYAFLSNYSQTNIYAGKVTSIPWLIQKHGADVDGLMSQMTVSLEQYFRRYFDEVAVVVERSKLDNPASNKVTMSLIVNVTDDGIKYSLAHAISMKDSNFLSYAKLNNEG